MKKIISIGKLTLSFAVIAFSIFLIIRISAFPEKINNLMIAEDISQKALQFNVENFHTQLEMWEYAYSPNDERLTTFENHNLTLNDDIKELATLVLNNKKALYSDGLAHEEKIISDLRQVQVDWTYLLSIIRDYRQVLESNASDAEIKQAKDSLDSEVFANEDLFDRLKFNEEVKLFATLQSEYAEELKNEISSLLTLSEIGISIIFILLIAGVFWSIWSHFKTSQKFI